MHSRALYAWFLGLSHWYYQSDTDLKSVRPQVMHPSPCIFLCQNFPWLSRLTPSPFFRKKQYLAWHQSYLWVILSEVFDTCTTFFDLINYALFVTDFIFRFSNLQYWFCNTKHWTCSLALSFRLVKFQLPKWASCFRTSFFLLCIRHNVFCNLFFHVPCIFTEKSAATKEGNQTT